MIKIIGLGAGDIDQLPYGIYKLLKESNHVYLRTQQHPVIDVLKEEGLCYTSFDKVYEKHDTFEAVYEEIAATLAAAAKKETVLYAVPGHPMMAERAVQILLAQDKDVQIVGGQSFLDAMFATLKIDPIEGFQLLDATSFEAESLSLKQHVIFCQVYNAQMASDVKLALLEKLPYDYDVYLVTAAGSAEESVVKVPLAQLDHVATLNNLTSLYVPPAAASQLRADFNALRQTVAALRAPGGCPWDQEQTHMSLIKNLREETEELIEALQAEDDENIIEELGDVLLQVMMHALIGEEEGYYTIDDVIEGINAKLIRRHPHVFGDLKAATPEEALAIWKEMKKQEK